MDPIKPAQPANDLLTRYGPTEPSGYKPVWFQRYRDRMTVQAKPFNKASTFHVNVQSVLQSTRDPEYGSYHSISNGANPGGYLWRIAYNKAYGELMDDVNSSQSQLAATLVEARKTADTVNSRAEWLWKHVTAQHRKVKGRRFARSKSIASIFIEYRWVYAATVGDIFSAVEFLQKWSPTTAVKGKGKAEEVRRTSVPLTGLKPGFEQNLYQEYARIKLKTLCKVTNPNLFWASQMGLTNPAALAWELTKFSWLADWFGTLGEVLNSWDDRLGLEFVNPCMTNVRSMVRTQTIKVWFQPWPNQPGRYAFTNVIVERKLYDRDPTIGGGPFLLVRQIKGPSLVRGATAIALLTQLLGGRK